MSNRPILRKNQTHILGRPREFLGKPGEGGACLFERSLKSESSRCASCCSAQLISQVHSAEEPHNSFHCQSLYSVRGIKKKIALLHRNRGIDDGERKWHRSPLKNGNIYKKIASSAHTNLKSNSTHKYESKIPKNT